MSVPAKVTTSNTKTNPDALASEIVSELSAYLDKKQTMDWSLATVQVYNAATADMPATITVLLRGSVIPNVRFMGTPPVVGDTVVVLLNATQYVSLGKLT